MIKRAVEQRPDDGYIVDSLGWAYYRISNYDDAVKNLERAIDLKPEDPTINDHLGDHFCVDSAASAACHKTFTESLILAQDERWRRA